MCTLPVWISLLFRIVKRILKIYFVISFIRIGISLFQIKPLFSPLSWTRLVQLGKKYSNPEKIPENESVRLDVTDKSKEERTKIHNTVKSIFKHLVSFYQYVLLRSTYIC